MLAAFLSGCILCIDGIHLGLKFFYLFLCDGWFDVFVIVVEEGWEHIFDSQVFLVFPERKGAGVDILCQELHEYLTTLAVAANDASGFPEADVIEKFSATDSYLANEQLVEVVGG